MGKVSKGTEQVSVGVNVEVTYDQTSGLPVSATGQKELVETSGSTGEEPVNILVILPATLTKYEQAVADAKKAYDDAITAAQSQLETDLVADNYPNGEFSAPKPAAEEEGVNTNPATTAAENNTTEQPAAAPEAGADAQPANS